ncbi:hypothetical protein [Amphritea balenae]|uniref:hypothetical protein n=1 Tax=Amphritea balenae TaxID=452629 RepID=UPI00147501AB|nr:hypothetical protein [Amphritea balenae]
MKIISAVIAVCLAGFLFFMAHDMEGISLMRLGYIAGAVCLITWTMFLFVKPQGHEEE